MTKLGPREAQLRAWRERNYDEARHTEETAPATLAATNEPSPNNAYARNARWRTKNPARYTEYMRTYMRRRRAQKKEAAA